MSPSSFLRLFLCVEVVACLAGCGGSSNGGSGGGGGSPTTVTYTFKGAPPTAVAMRIGTGPYTQTALQSGILSISIPSGTTNYSVAYVCPEISTPSASVSGGERVILASIQDGTSFSLFCAEPIAANLGTATVQVNAAAISGAAFVSVGDVGPQLQPWSGSTLSFSSQMVTGTHDVAVYALDANGNALAVRVLRNQTIPGVLNGGNPVLLGSGDLTVPQTITYNNAPAGFSAPTTLADYLTAGGAEVILNFNATSQYLAVPSGEAQSGDSYAFAAGTRSAATTGEYMFVQKPPGSGGGPQTFTFPAPWPYAGPAAAALPTFNFDYSGFSGMTNVSQSAEILWVQGMASASSIDVTASGNYQNGATTISVPDLSGLTGFIAPAPAGMAVNWFASISQGLSLDSVVSGTTVSSLSNSGTYTEP